MSLVLYSGGHYFENLALNKKCMDLSGRRTPKVTFIPASSDYGLEEFREFVEAWDKIKNCQFVYFPIDYQYSDELKNRALSSDIIFLSGGNTFYFLKHLKENGLMEALATAHQSGRVIAGLSAGAILMTPNINTASFPSFDCDENFVGIKSKKALNFVNFEIFPHYIHSARYRSALKTYSQKSRNGIYALPDGTGIVVTQQSLEVIGPSYLFLNGHEHNMSKVLRNDVQTFCPVERRRFPRLTDTNF